MTVLADFSSIPFVANVYDGAAEKYTARIGDAWYMFKFGEELEPDPKKPLQASYENTPVSEYIGSNVFASVGIPSQEVLLGDACGRIAVACKDFIRARGGSYELVEFRKLEKSVQGGSSSPQRTPDYDYTLKIYREHPWLEGIREDAISRYWQMLCIDALLGNFDRHSGNWGFILDLDSMELVECAPVYDCGSCLYPKLAEHEMERFLADPESLRARVLAFPNVTLMVDGKRPGYREFLLSEKGRAARTALLGIYPKIDLTAISGIVDETPGISDVRRSFYKALIEARMQEILEPAHRLACK